MYKNSLHLNRGFTLIEMLVSLSLFTIVATISVGAFLSLIGSSQSVQNEQSVMTTLTFVMDSMTREIRTGTYYYCSNSIFNTQESYGKNTNDCEFGANGVSFIESGTSVTGGSAQRIAYYYDGVSKTIFRRVGNTAAQSIVSSGINVTSALFYATGTDRLSLTGDNVQPNVTIILQAIDDEGKIVTLQTTVTQRELDI